MSASFTTCPWHVHAPSNNPEPSCEADCWVEIECGAPITMDSADSWHCAHGHEHVSMFDGITAYNLHNLEVEAVAERDER
tara:strand:- start:666 stop:905 length:240 start_codon:yes stop_codon:yes gene_type:complete